MDLENGELVPLTEFRRDLNRIMGELQDGRREKVVLTRHGNLECVVVAVPTYEEMENA
jgi:PHD/YefM family antitoxin component YafN of YafNO toxin-antitoxin module